MQENFSYLGSILDALLLLIAIATSTTSDAWVEAVSTLVTSAFGSD